MSGRAEWLAWRRGGIGSSDVAGLLGLSPWSSPWSVWVSKVSDLDDDDPHDDDRYEFGRRAEVMLAEWMTDRTGLHVVGEQTWVTHRAEPWRRCTPDGFVVESPASTIGDAIGIVEIKTDSGGPWDEIPIQYQTQVQWTLATTELPRAWVAVLHTRGSARFRIYEVEANEQDQALIVDRARTFWHDHVAAGVPPRVDGSAATTRALSGAWTPVESEAIDLGDDAETLIEQWRTARADAEHAKQRLGEIENELRAMLGEATEGLRNGELLVSWRPQSRSGLNTRALRTDHPEIAEEYATTSTFRVLRPHGGAR